MDKERIVQGMSWAKFCEAMKAVNISHNHKIKPTPEQKRLQKELKKK